MRIPVSNGPRIAPQVTQASVPDNASTVGQVWRGIGAAGADIANIGLTMQQEDIQRQEALKAAKVADYQIKLRELDNNLELEAMQTASTPEQFQGLSQRLAITREEQINSILENEADPVVKNLVLRTAASYGVDTVDKFKRYELSKEAEFGKYTVEKRLDQLGTDLAKASSPSDVNNIRAQVNSTLQWGLKSRYIDFNFIESYQDKQRQAAATQEASAVQQAALNSFLDGSAHADPSNPQDRKVIDNAFAKILASNDPDTLDKAVILSTKTGVVPSQLKTTLQGRLYSGDASQKAQAASLIAKIGRDNPRVLSQFDETTQAQAVAINQNLEAGVDPVKAVEFAQNEIKQNKSFERERRSQVLESNFTPKKRQAFLEDLAQEIRPSGDVAIPSALEAEYEYLTRQYFMNEGLDFEKAQKAAIANVKSRWKTTNVGQKRLQKYSPESQYGITGVDDSWIRTQALDFAQTYMPSKPRKDLKNDLELVVDPASVISGNPKYFAKTTLNEYGLKGFILDEKNQPVRFKPDFSKTSEYKNAVNARKALSVSEEQFAQELYKQKQKETVTVPSGVLPRNYIPKEVDRANRKGPSNYNGGLL